MIEQCQAVDPSINKRNYLRRVVKSAENFIIDLKNRGDVRVRCACKLSSTLCDVFSKPMPDIDRMTFVEKVAEILVSGWDSVPCWKRDRCFRKKIKSKFHESVNKHWEAIQLKYS